MAIEPAPLRVEHGARYAIAWRDADGAEATGNLVFEDAELVLRGRRTDGTVARRRVPLALLGSVRIGRSDPDRIQGERSVVLELSEGGMISIAPLGEAGAVFELADLLAELGSRPRKRPSSPIVLVLPLRTGAASRARELVAAGPPFDLEHADLDSHEVFVTEREVVFVFEGARARETVERILRRPAVLRAAASWRGILDGRPRLGEASFAWQPTRTRDASSRG